MLSYVKVFIPLVLQVKTTETPAYGDLKTISLVFSSNLVY